jgi:hypothetical protein
MTTVTNDTNVNTLITNAVLAAATQAPPPSQSNNYRFYHCHQDLNGLKCKKVEGPSTMPTDEWTKLLFVKSYIPERFDKHILKYQWMPDRVIIEENGLKTK